MSCDKHARLRFTYTTDARTPDDIRAHLQHRLEGLGLRQLFQLIVQAARFAAILDEDVGVWMLRDVLALWTQHVHYTPAMMSDRRRGAIGSSDTVILSVMRA